MVELVDAYCAEVDVTTRFLITKILCMCLDSLRMAETMRAATKECGIASHI